MKHMKNMCVSPNVELRHTYETEAAGVANSAGAFLRPYRGGFGPLRVFTTASSS